VAPAGTSQDIVSRLNAIMNKSLTSQESLERFQKSGLEPATTTPQGFHDLLESDLKMWTRIIKEAKITVDVLP
jgi:tripartite-type tricarboxylate transporter receptor subunit TctC